VQAVLVLFLVGLAVPGPAQAAEAADCPNLTQVIKEINIALLAAEIDEAAALATRAQDALLCQQDPINPLVLFQVFQYAGAVQIFQGQEDAARATFETAVAMAPGQNLDPILGSDAEELFQQVRIAVLERPPGQLQAHFDGEAWIDGHRAVTGGTVGLTPGVHLFQLQVPGEPLAARLLHVTGAETRKIAFGEAAEARLEAAVAAANAPPLAEPVALHGLRTPLLVSGGGLLAAGAGLMVVARIKFGDFNSSTFETESDLTPEEQLSQKRDVTNTYAVFGLGSAALGAGLLGVGVLVGDAPGITVRGQW
jgi:hypothetical protein